MNLCHQRLGKNLPRNARLVRHYDHGQARFIQFGDCRGRKRKDMQPADMVEITHLFANGSVAIEENRRAQGLCVRQGVGSKRSKFWRGRWPSAQTLAQTSEENGRLQKHAPRKCASCSDDRWDICAESRGCTPLARE